jgi:uncharacterized protein YbaP (TraB family)
MIREAPSRYPARVGLVLSTLTLAATLSAGNLPLWKVEGGKATVWLLGSVHFLKASDYPLPAPIEAAYDEAQVVVFETDMAALQSPAVQLQLVSKGRLPEGTQLSDQLSKPTYEKLMEHAARAGLPAFILDSMKPSLAVTMIVAAELARLGFDPEHGVDLYFHGKSEADGKKIAALETVEFQIDLITGFSAEEGEVMVETSLEELETVSGVFTELVSSWRKGDTASLDKWLNEAKKEAPTIMKRLLTDRNKQWTPKIRELADGNVPVLVVVGAGHLVGSDSVIELLEAGGLNVVQQ